MKRFFALLVGAFLVLGATQMSQASTIPLGNIPANGGSATLGYGFGTHTTAGTGIDDTITFSLATKSNLSGLLLNFPISFGPFALLNATNLMISLDGGASVAAGMFNYAALAVGSHSFHVTGDGSGFFGGLYGLGFTTAAAAAPIPASLLMFLTALVGLGGFSYRRRLTGGSETAA